ncbi:SMC-Scp complex subunit ScpB [Ectothiorhodospiraceae bacterium 2226]|nr:SMC-Scp complex subunit ScpB [Ectothiorhodospiraceae bacterium 2226]
MNRPELKHIVEAALLAAGEPLSVERLLGLFGTDEPPARREVLEALEHLGEDCAGRGIELQEVASGWRLQVRQDLAPWVSRLWEERPARYSRALMETLALIAYRQPITRAEIEDIRGVSVSTQIVKTLLEREWVRVVGHRDVPGRPALYGTTRTFLDYFGLSSLDELPTLAELRDIDRINAELDLGAPDALPSEDQPEPGEEEVHAVADDLNDDAAIDEGGPDEAGETPRGEDGGFGAALEADAVDAEHDDLDEEPEAAESAR